MKMSDVKRGKLALIRSMGMGNYEYDNEHVRGKLALIRNESIVVAAALVQQVQRARQDTATAAARAAMRRSVEGGDALIATAACATPFLVDPHVDRERMRARRNLDPSTPAASSHSGQGLFVRHRSRPSR